MDLDSLDLMFIENVGNLVCPVSFPLGEDLRVAVISTTEGEDKPLKYPTAIARTNALVITKTDIAGYVGVDPKKMAEYAHGIHPDIRIFFSRLTGGPDSALEAVSEDGTQTLEAYLLG